MLQPAVFVPSCCPHGATARADTPSVCSLQVRYDPTVLPLCDLLEMILAIDAALPAAQTQTGTEVQTQIDAQQLRQSVLSPRKPHQTSKFRGSDRDGLVD